MNQSKGNGDSNPVQERRDPANKPSAKQKKIVHSSSILPETDDMEQLIAMMGSEEVAEESMTLEREENMSMLPGIPLQPIPTNIPLRTNRVYGLYRGVLGAFELELRVDIDGPAALQKISGDYYQISGQTKSYYGSFIVDSIIKTIANGIITITGTAKTSWATSYNKIKLGIKQTTVFQQLAPSILQWFHASTNAPGAMYICNFADRAYRQVKLEQDCTSGIAQFISYNSGSLPSGGTARVLSINSAFSEAGINLLNAGTANIVPLVNISGPANLWSNAELHLSMVNNFSLYQNNTQWAVWLLHAYEHEYGPGLYGIMFDQQGLQRQGCAVFYKGVGGSTNEQRRLQLYTCVHELGHCFNLLHSWQKSLATPPRPNIPNSLSYMNYPWGYPGGPAAFWNSFPFQFDPVEISHMRHAFRNDVIMGGSPFTVGSALQDTGNLFEDPLENHTSLLLELEAKKTYMLGEPVYLETKLKTTGNYSTKVVSSLHADYGFVSIAIIKPGGNMVIYEPLAERCALPETTLLNPGNPSIYESSYIGFGKDGLLFDQAGLYKIKAVYFHEDGSRIVSNTLSVRVKNPLNAEEDEIAELMLQDDVGYLAAFSGSDAEYLRSGNEALTLISEKYKDNPMAAYAQFIKGVNCQRTFKTITPEKGMEIRQPDNRRGEALLAKSIEKSKGPRGLDNITLGKAMQTLIKTNQQDGNKKAAEAVAKDMVGYFNSLPIKQHVKEKIKKQSARILSGE